MNFLLDDLIGFKIEAEDGEIGTIHNVLFDDEAWVVRYVIVDTGGWLFGRKVLLAPESVHEPDEEHKLLRVDLTKQQVKDSPEIPVDPPLSREEEAQYRDHFRWPTYWGDRNALDHHAMISISPEATALGGMEPSIPQAPPIPDAPTDHMLRSARKLRGYGLRAGSEKIGEVKDFVIDGEDWTIPYLVADLESEDDHDGRLIPTSAVLKTGWKDEVIAVSSSRDSIQGAPRFDANMKRDKVFLDGVSSHYERSLKV